VPAAAIRDPAVFLKPIWRNYLLRPRQQAHNLRRQCGNERHGKKMLPVLVGCYDGFKQRFVPSLDRIGNEVADHKKPLFWRRRDLAIQRLLRPQADRP
jgi:hypothetical protein